METYRPRWSEPGPHAVLERERVLAASAQALQAGVRSGMKRGGALAICPDAVLHERDDKRERAALDSIALCLLQYTPEVAFAAQQSLVMDVSASLRAFGGMRRLSRLVQSGVLALGFTAWIGMAPTAQGAWLLAHAAAAGLRRRRVARMETLVKRLNHVSCGLLPSLRPYQDWLHGIGCRTLGDLRRLPRAGLKRRCDDAVLDELDRAYGQAPELFNWIATPERFSARLELPNRIDDAEGVLFGARRLILQMTGWLTARQRAVERFTLAMEHERGRQAVPPTLLEIVLAEAAWQEAHLTRLLQERLTRMTLAASVIALRMEATQTVAMTPPSESLFPEPGGTPADFKRLVELLSARLGDDCVLVPAMEADHRPEVCNRWLPAATARRAALPGLPDNERPFWLLESPLPLIVRGDRPFYGSPLRLAGPAERIECGWWDGKLVVRDYFPARGAEPAWYWVYRERLGEDVRWYLHGLFA
ncbi:MAG TPA: DNA polymerase Y family protein [Noviherbaspirillum sp.]|nr:DNA polymerase Y family protein [Noviherbaspirillum sp.]